MFEQLMLSPTCVATEHGQELNKPNCPRRKEQQCFVLHIVTAFFATWDTSPLL